MDLINRIIEYGKKGLLIARKLNYRRLQGSFLSKLGGVYRNISQYDTSLITLKQALRLTRKTKERWTEGNTLREMGIVHYLTGLPDSSLAYWNESLEIFGSIPDWPMVGMVTGHIGVFYKNTGRPFEALKAYEKALKLVGEVNNEREKANILGNIGGIYNDLLSDYAKVERYFQKALKIKERLGEMSFVGKIVGNLGVIRKNQGDYQSSLAYYHRAIKIAQDRGDRANEGKLNGSIGTIFLELDENEKALEYSNKSVKIWEEIGQKDKMAEVLINMGGVYANMGENSVASHYYQKAKSLAIEQGHKDFLITIQLNTGSIYHEQGKFDIAMQSYEAASQIAREISSVAHEGRSLILLGGLNEELERFAAALKNYKDGLKIARRIDSPEGIWKALFGIGSVLEKQGEKEEAVAKYAAAVDTIESIRSKLTVESLKESFMEGKIEPYHTIIALLLELGRIKEAFDYMERAKARNLLDIISTDRINITEGITPELLEKKKEVEWKLRMVNEQLTREFTKEAEKQNKKLVAALEDSLKTIRFNNEEIRREIKLNHPQYAQLSGIRNPLSVQEIQRKVLNKDEALVEFLVTEEQVLVGIVSPEFLNFRKLDISKEELTNLIKRLLQPFREVKAGKIKNFTDIVYNLKLAQELYLKIFQPIENLLIKHKSIIIVPDGILHYLPFEALVTEIEQKTHARDRIFSRYENAHYLVEKYVISYAHSASVLDPELLDGFPGKSRGLLAFGNPQFGDVPTEEKEQGILAFFSMLIRGPASNSWTFPQLPASEEEVKEVAKIIKPSTFYIGAEAREEKFKQKAGEFQYLHISTHSVPEEMQPMYSRIVFAQDDDPDEDGFLHAYEVLNLNLNAELVTLSACETGLGKLSRGEGLIGLTRAFMYAGAQSVLVSLWSVDESTADLMKYFYKNLKNGFSKAKALQKAKLSLLRLQKTMAGQQVSFAHPYLWAPFVLVGEGN